MKSAYLISPNKIEIVEKSIPLLKEGEVLIRIKSALTCGTDLKAYLRGHPLIPMPGPFGHEFSGIIEEIGEGVNGFKKGDAVMLVHTAPCGQCPYCKRGLFNLCEVLTKDMMLGAFSEFIVVKMLTFPKAKFNDVGKMLTKEQIMLGLTETKILSENEVVTERTIKDGEEIIKEKFYRWNFSFIGKDIKGVERVILSSIIESADGNCMFLITVHGQMDFINEISKDLNFVVENFNTKK